MLTHWDRDEIDAILQAKFSDVFCWMKMHWLRLKFHWNILPRVQLTIFQHLTVQPRRTGVTLADAVTRSKRRSSFETAIILSFFIVRVKTNISITNIGIIGDSGTSFWHAQVSVSVCMITTSLQSTPFKYCSLYMFKKGWLPEQVLRIISREKMNIVVIFLDHTWPQEIRIFKNSGQWWRLLGYQMTLAQTWP